MCSSDLGLAELGGLDLVAAVYDGDTQAPIRQTVRAAGQIVITNPDMLHAAILPHHTKWFALFEQLRVIVIDEAHVYRGVFGSHVANVIRRLLRICAHYGSAPRIVCASATVANPGELATTLTGRPMRVIDRNGAPSAEKHLVVLAPPPIDRRTGARPGPNGLARRSALTFLRAGRQTIVFGRSRTGVEILLTGIREALREHRGPVTSVRGYRGGYLPGERREIERRQGVTRAGLASIERELIQLASRTELFPKEQFAILPGKPTIYRLAEDPDHRFALYASAGALGKYQPPHNHTTWAVIAGVYGQDGTLREKLGGGPGTKVQVDPYMLAAIQQGLLGVTQSPDGTAYAAFKGFPVQVAGKTGTAEKLGKRDFAWFAGYAPADDPTLVEIGRAHV